MAEKLRLAGPRLAPAANRDIREIQRWSGENFGESAALRYAALLKQAHRDIVADPKRYGSKQRSEIMIADARIYHLAFSRDRVAGGKKVAAPRHFLLYRSRKDGVLEVARILHDARDLARHLPRAYRIDGRSKR